MPARPTPRPTVRLGIEPLESRTTPAGNVSAILDGVTLVLQADRHSHVLQVDVYDDRVVVRALDATAINGQRPPTGFASANFVGGPGTIAALVFEGNGGGDSLTVQTAGLTAMRSLDVSVRTYGGVDHFGLAGGMIAGDVRIDTGSHADSVVVTGNYPGVALEAALGTGNDTLRVSGSVGQVVALEGAGGNDRLEMPTVLYGLFAGNVTGFESVTLT